MKFLFRSDRLSFCRRPCSYENASYSRACLTACSALSRIGSKADPTLARSKCFNCWWEWTLFWQTAAFALNSEMK